jgi:hypothetical protein
MKLYWLLFLSGPALPPDGGTFYGPFDTLAQCQAKADIVAPVEQGVAGPHQEFWAQCNTVREGDPSFVKGLDSWIDANGVPGQRRP